MDVLVLIDKLDDLVHNAKAVPLTDQVRIDREEIYDILDQMRATIPEEIKQARWIVKERQEMLAEAKREVDRLLAEAREQAVREASQTEIVKIAERQADEIVDDARRSAREMKLEMEDWADNQLASLEVNLERFLTAVRRGRERLHERSQESGARPADRALASAARLRSPTSPGTTTCGERARGTTWEMVPCRATEWPPPTNESTGSRTNRRMAKPTVTQIQRRLRFLCGGCSATSPRSVAQVAAKRRGSLSPRISVAETPSASASARSDSSSVAISSARRSGTPSRFHSCRHSST